MGQLVMHGVNLRTPASDWLDAAWATIATAPHEVLKELTERITTAEVLIDPQRARETWGLLPEHQALSAPLERAGEPADGGR